jgi:hypothetical protein
MIKISQRVSGIRQSIDECECWKEREREREREREIKNLEKNKWIKNNPQLSLKFTSQTQNIFAFFRNFN